MDPERSCPLGHTCSQCHWHILIQGKDPSTGQDVNRKDCAVAWLPMLLIENSMRQYQTGAAVDKLHAAVATDNNDLRRIMANMGAMPSASGDQEVLSHEPQ